MNGRRCTPTVCSGTERSVPTFFHGSTDVRASSLSGSFSEHLATKHARHARLCFRLSSAMSTSWSLAFFRGVRRADQAVAHAIELDFDECLLYDGLLERVKRFSWHIDRHHTNPPDMAMATRCSRAWLGDPVT